MLIYFIEEVIMKIIGINASPKGNANNTLQLVKFVLEGTESEGAETELVDLYKLHIEYLPDAEPVMLQASVLYSMISPKYLKIF
jgi:NADPH-dependent 7-cyano-7-deazaguanine reductase QueF